MPVNQCHAPEAARGDAPQVNPLASRPRAARPCGRQDKACSATRADRASSLSDASPRSTARRTCARGTRPPRGARSTTATGRARSSSLRSTRSRLARVRPVLAVVRTRRSAQHEPTERLARRRAHRVLPGPVIARARGDDPGEAPTPSAATSATTRRSRATPRSCGTTTWRVRADAGQGAARRTAPGVRITRAHPQSVWHESILKRTTSEMGRTPHLPDLPAARAGARSRGASRRRRRDARGE